VQALLQSHGPTLGPPSSQRFGALLKGLLRCVPCDCAMTPAHTTRKGRQRYRYYTCSAAQKRGWQTCPSKSIPAAPLEQLVIEQIQRLGRDPQLLQQVLAQVRHEDDARRAELESERVALEQDLLRSQGEAHRLLAEVGMGQSNGRAVTRLATLQDRLGQLEQRLTRLRAQREALEQARLDEAAATRALAELEPSWEQMTPQEQGRLVRLLVARVNYDGGMCKMAITFHPLGLKTLAGQRLSLESEEHSA
jgi:site-specific DNA recombinase